MKTAIKFFNYVVRKVIAATRKALNMVTTAKAMKDHRFIKMSHGNRKLKDSIETAFLVWNLPAIVTCPYATESCKANCYACKAERIYPDALKSRYAHLEMSKQDDFVERVIYTIEAEYHSQRVQKFANRRLVVRIHESGDFYDKHYALKWLDIAKHFEGNDRIVFMAYTKSLPFFRNEYIPKIFVIRASVWCDTDSNLEMESYETYPVYTAYTYTEIEAMKETVVFHEIETAPENGAEWLVCRCSDCGTCNACWSGKFKNVVCAIH